MEVQTTATSPVALLAIAMIIVTAGFAASYWLGAVGERRRVQLDAMAVQRRADRTARARTRRGKRHPGAASPALERATFAPRQAADAYRETGIDQTALLNTATPWNLSDTYHQARYATGRAPVHRNERTHR